MSTFFKLLGLLFLVFIWVVMSSCSAKVAAPICDSNPVQRGTVVDVALGQCKAR